MPRRTATSLTIAAAVLLTACQAGTAPSPSPEPPASAEASVSSLPPQPYAGAEARIQMAAGPRGVAYAGGSLWVANTRGDVIQRVDPATNEVVAEVRAGQRPVTLVADGDALWASWLNGEPSSDDEVVRIDPATGAIDLRVAVPVFHNIAVGAGAVWAIDGVGQLRRIDALTGEVSIAAAAGSGSVGLAADEEAVWGIRNDRTVWRFDVAGGALAEAGLEVAVPGRSRVAATADGVWIAVPGAVLALEKATMTPLAELGLPGLDLVNDLFVTGDDVWLSANLTDAALALDGGAILRLDPATLEIRDAYRLGPESSGVVPAEGSVWAVDQQDDLLVRFPLAD